MKSKILTGIFAVFVFSLLGLATVSAEEMFSITDVDFDDPVAPGQTIPVTITFENKDLTKDIEDIKLKVWLFDEAHSEVIGEKLKLDLVQIHQSDDKDVAVNVLVPADTEAGKYLLKVEATGEWEDSEIATTARFDSVFEVEQQEDSLAITKVELSSDKATAGDAVDAAVTVLNNGQSDESDVKITVSVDGAKQTVTIPTLMEAEEQTVYLTLQLPSTLSSGLHTVRVEAFNALTSATSAKDLVVEAASVPSTIKEVVSATFPLQTIPAGKSSVFSLQVTNNQATPKTFSLTVGGLQDWASNTRVDPASVTLGAGESATVQVHLIPTKGGEHTFALFVRDGASTVATQLVKVNVTGAAVTSNSLTTAGLVLFIVLVLIAIGAYAKFRRENGGKKAIYY